MSARCVMVLGTSSGAGKSFLATALCRCYANAGLRVAPFKAQNMSNNARVVAGPDGEPGEIGSAQYFQALAARAQPDVRMNPVLLKPEADTRSQVVVHGRVRADLARMPWRERSARLWPFAGQALASLRAEHDVVVIEGAGSPAEINLAASDFVNTRTALAAEAACLLVADIDRGGAFAHLYGTHALMDARVRARLAGFVLNRFRGDAALLAPAPQQLEQLTGVPTLAVLPMRRDHGLPEEDGVYDDGAAPAAPDVRTIAVIAPPAISNLDEFQPLRTLPGHRLVWARDAAACAAAHWLVLPGSKHTRADLQWLRAQGLDRAIAAHVQAGRPLLGVCGGLQMLGDEVADPLGLEGGARGSTPGLGLLPLRTEFAARKTLRHGNHRFGALHDAWAPLSQLAVQGYEIHVGRTQPSRDDPACRAVLPQGLGWQRGPVLGVYLHGLFENPALLRALFGVDTPPLDERLDRLAAQVQACFTPHVLLELLR
ncbi:MAG: cobyric acid synthase [Pseudomonadota bacterium]